jgi:hypothetical protein
MSSPDTRVQLTSSRRSLAVVFRWPLLVGIASGYGLVAALVADGFWDWVGALTLFVPVALASWFWLRPARRQLTPP